MLSDLGDTVGGAFKQARQQQLLSMLGSDLAGNDYSAALQHAAQGGADLNTVLSLAKLGQDQANLAKGNAVFAGIMGGGAPPASQTSVRPASYAPTDDAAGNAIASIESRGSGDYTALGPLTKTGDRAYGRYGIMGNNIPQWTQAALGRSLTPEQFIADQAAQDATFKHRFGQYVAKYGPEGAARAWFAGEGGMNNPNARDILGTSVADYSRKFTAAYSPSGSPPAGTMAFTGPTNDGDPIKINASVDGGDDAARAKLEAKRDNITRAIGSPYMSDAQRSAAKILLEQTNQQLKDLDKEKWTPVPQSDFAKYGIPADYKGPVLRNVNGDIKAPMKPTTEVNIQQKAEGAYDQEVAKQYAKTYGDIQEAGRNSVSEVNTLKYMQKIVDDPSFYSGTGGPVATQAKRALASLGITDAKDAAPNELFEKLSNKAILDAAGGSLGAGISNADRDFIARTTANTGNTKEGNRQILAVGLAVARRKADLAKLARDYAKANGGRLDMGFDQKLSEWAEKNPLFPQAAQQPAPTQPAPQPQGGARLSPAETQESLANARAAIAKGIPKEAVIQRLRQNGIDASGL
ncbi:MAG: hypothetical protein JSS66_18965 [Armatimonadetes bacterium]|nr:hypothetical protein [Armatimonadota bacterium]